MSVQDLPHINASLNALSAVLVVCGFACIRRKKVAAHKACMIAAVGVSVVFLVCYLTYHFQVGSVPFTGQGPIRFVYFSILLSHTVLAATLPILISITVHRAVKNRIPEHRRIARWTLPIWLYVSITGVIVYLMLYQLDR